MSCQSLRPIVLMYSTLLPRMKQSPYFALSWPLMYFAKQSGTNITETQKSERSRALAHLLGLLHRDVHVAVKACEYPAIIDPRVEFHLLT